MPQADLLIHADWLLTGRAEDPPLEHHSLAVRDGAIVAMGPRAGFTDWQTGAVHDLAGHGLLPGLINAHGHAAMSLLRGAARDAPVQQWLAEQIWPLEAALVDAEFVRDGVRLAMAEMIRAGITGFADMYFFPEITAEEAAGMIHDKNIIGFSGFTPAGAVKAVPMALAARARAEHEAGRDFKVGVITGASTGDSLDGELARAEAIPHVGARSIPGGKAIIYEDIDRLLLAPLGECRTPSVSDLFVALLGREVCP